MSEVVIVSKWFTGSIVDSFDETDYSKNPYGKPVTYLMTENKEEAKSLYDELKSLNIDNLRFFDNVTTNVYELWIDGVLENTYKPRELAIQKGFEYTEKVSLTFNSIDFSFKDDLTELTIDEFTKLHPLVPYEQRYLKL